MMGILQLVVVVMCGWRLMISLICDGKERLDRNGYPIKYSFSADLGGVAIAFIILYFG